MSAIRPKSSFDLLARDCLDLFLARCWPSKLMRVRSCECVSARLISGALQLLQLRPARPTPNNIEQCARRPNCAQALDGDNMQHWQAEARRAPGGFRFDQRRRRRRRRPCYRDARQEAGAKPLDGASLEQVSGDCGGGRRLSEEGSLAKIAQPATPQETQTISGSATFSASGSASARGPAALRLDAALKVAPDGCAQWGPASELPPPGAEFIFK